MNRVVSQAGYGHVSKRTSDGRVIRVCGPASTGEERRALVGCITAWCQWGKAGSPSYFALNRRQIRNGWSMVEGKMVKA